ncbi:hypothetical protein BDF19DRAFT_182526 [Syncephalis fuscata]|nr:hypothetical protein BDF19DRAFT_182526 [Syncephalis fuscata]
MVCHTYIKMAHRLQNHVFCNTLALLYACARVIMLAKLKMLHLNLLLASFVVTIVYCIFFLMHLTMLYQPSKSTGLYGIYTILSGVPFDLILWYWSIVGRNLFSKRSIILLRSIIIIDIASNIARTILTAMDSDISSDGFRILFENQMDVYVIIFALSWLNTIVFGGFGKLHVCYMNQNYNLTID